MLHRFLSNGSSVHPPEPQMEPVERAISSSIHHHFREDLGITWVYPLCIYYIYVHIIIWYYMYIENRKIMKDLETVSTSLANLAGQDCVLEWIKGLRKTGTKQSHWTLSRACCWTDTLPGGAFAGRDPLKRLWRPGEMVKNWIKETSLYSLYISFQNMYICYILLPRVNQETIKKLQTYVNVPLANSLRTWGYPRSRT